MIKPEQNGQQDGKRDGEKDLADADVPEMDKPTAIGGGEERLACGQRLDVHILHVPHVDKTGEEDDGQRSAVVLDELPHVPLQQVALPEHATTIGKA